MVETLLPCTRLQERGFWKNFPQGVGYVACHEWQTAGLNLGLSMMLIYVALKV